MKDTGQGLLTQALARENMQRAWKRVKANKGAAGVDGLDITQTGQHLKHAWPTIRQQLMEGTYRPKPVRRIVNNVLTIAYFDRLGMPRLT